MVEDAFVNIEQFMAEEIADLFAFQEGAAFINGTGLAGNQPNALAHRVTRRIEYGIERP